MINGPTGANFHGSEGLQGLSSTSGQDPDGLPSFQSIESMSNDQITDQYDSLSKSDQDPLPFLAKVAVTAEKLGLEGKSGRRLIALSVELYAKDLGIDPLNTNPKDGKNLQKVVGNLAFQAAKYTGKGEDGVAALKSMIDSSRAAFESWVIFEKMMS